MVLEEWHLTLISNALGVVFAILILALLRRVVCGSKSTGLGNTVLVLGHTGAGKTALVRRLLRGGFPTTCVSMKEAVFDGVRLACEAEDGSTAGGPLRVVEFPGHPRLRSAQRIGASLAEASVILFVINSADISKAHVGTCAEYLYDVMTNEDVDRRRPALMVVCSQSDRDAAASKAYLRAQLEKELSKLKETRPSLAAEGDDAGASAAILLGRKGRDFEFAEDCPCETKFCEFSAKPDEAGKSGGGVLRARADWRRDWHEVEVFIRDFIA